MRTVLLSMIVLLLASHANAQEEVTGTALVLQADQLYVMDGEKNHRIPIFGIDAPDPDQDRECRVGRQFFGCYSNAKRQLEIIVDEGPVTCTPTGHWNYVAFPYMICKSASGEDIGDLMVRSGNALAFLPQSDMYVEAEEEARAAERGIWQPQIQFTIPWEWRQINARPTFGP